MESDYSVWADLAGAGKIIWDMYMSGWYYIFNGNEDFAPKLPVILLYCVHFHILNFAMDLLQIVGIGSGGPMPTKTENQRMAEDIHFIAKSTMWNNLSNGRSVDGHGGKIPAPGMRNKWS